MNWDDFQQRVIVAIPKQTLKPNRCWIGVLRHDKPPEASLEERDFIWMIGHDSHAPQSVLEADTSLTYIQKMPIQTIQEAYLKLHRVINFRLKHRDALVDQNGMVRSYLRLGSDLVLFWATCAEQSMVGVIKESASPTLARQDPKSLEARSNVPPMTLPTDGAKTTEPRSAGLALHRPQLNSPFPIANKLCPSPSPIDRDLSSIPKDSLPQRKANIDAIAIPDGAKSSDIPHVRSWIKQHCKALLLVWFNPIKLLALIPIYPTRSLIHNTEESFLKLWLNRLIWLANRDTGTTLRWSCMEVLNELQEKFPRYAASNTDAQSWKQAIEKLLPQAEQTRTVIGVVGNTGAGKSSVVNAMLNEENLVPTNCMRACTAVVTEISWNDSMDTSAKYRDWEEELSLDEGFSNWRRRSLTWHLRVGLRCWYRMGQISIGLSEATQGHAESIQSLRSDDEDRRFEHPRDHKNDRNSSGNRKKCNKKGRGNDGDDQEHRDGYWPLIKVVRIYTKSPALSTGAVIVDLPGVHDSNAARAAVAQGYLKHCTGLWIVAPISRAVDDKAAKTLLGGSFRRQLKYDGGFSSVTFICSKTDDISVTEAINSLELDGTAELEELSNENRTSIKKIEDKIESLRESQQACEAALSRILKDMDI
ncbi:tat pathway signal sequence [Pyrenophora seminiperda CCB06]|uniref:Tat pathway signal sequence n=1 Tax=Pyrenophora seminiperda CCB06 TaxID=1302712 RepID=A0A3M7LZQ6_9PLEO|nr:tat pathway signal sequence [Pyrenophora seminiperda CCB06]